MRFPLADWIDDHDGCRHNLGASGMKGSIRRPAISGAGSGYPRTEELSAAIARSIGVDGSRVFLTHGATEANAWVTFYLARSRDLPNRACRVRFPEYPPLSDVAREAGWTVRDDGRPAALAVVSQPRNPEGDRWTDDATFRWADGARHLLIDETFREFAGTPSFARSDRPRLWTTGSFTKFYAADDLRVGFIVAPEPEAARFGRFLGLVADEIPDRSIAAAFHLLERREEVRAQVDRLLARNRSTIRAALPSASPPVGPVFFDRSFRGGGDRLARRCLDASVLVCPGSFFGDPAGVRIGLTRRSFPVDLAAYLRIRDAPSPGATDRLRTPRGRRAREPVARGMRTRA